MLILHFTINLILQIIPNLLLILHFLLPSNFLFRLEKLTVVLLHLIPNRKRLFQFHLWIIVIILSWQTILQLKMLITINHSRNIRWWLAPVLGNFMKVQILFRCDVYSFINSSEWRYILSWWLFSNRIWWL